MVRAHCCDGHPRWIGVAALVLCILVIASQPRAEEAAPQAPLWEVGALLIGGWFPDYPASNQNHVHALPVPYVVYRGQYFQLSETSARGIVFKTPFISFDFSVSGAFPSSSSDRARQGMPSLDYTLQLGPRVNVLLSQLAPTAKLDLEVPVRTVLSTNITSLAFRGFVLVPEIAYSNDRFLAPRGRLKIGIGPQFATTRLMDYFYEVQPQFATAGRPAYTATGGYLGSRIDISYRVPLSDRITLFAAFVPQLYTGASNARSPLFKRDWGLSTGLGISFSFYTSERKTENDLE